MKSKQFIHFSLYHSNLKDVTTYLQILLIHLNCKIQLVMIIHLAYKEYFQNASDYRRSTLVSEGRLCQQFISRLRQQIWCRIPSSPQAGKHCFAIQKSNWSYPNTSIYFLSKGYHWNSLNRWTSYYDSFKLTKEETVLRRAQQGCFSSCFAKLMPSL